jgi:hypothetical protein
MLGFRHGHAALFLRPNAHKVEANIRWDGLEYANTYDLRFLAGWEVVSWKAVPLESRRVLLALRCKKGDEFSIWAVSLYVAQQHKQPTSVPDHHLVQRGVIRDAGEIPSLLIDGDHGATLVVGHLSQGEAAAGDNLGDPPTPRFDGSVYFNLCPWPISVGGYAGAFSTPLAEHQPPDTH